MFRALVETASGVSRLICAVRMLFQMTGKVARKNDDWYNSCL